MGAEALMSGWLALLTHLPDWGSAGLDVLGQGLAQSPVCPKAWAGMAAWMQRAPVPHLPSTAAPQHYLLFYWTPLCP